MFVEGEAEEGPPLEFQEKSLRFVLGEGLALEGDSHLDLLLFD